MSFVFSLQWGGRCEEAQDFYRNSRVFTLLFVAAQERRVQRKRSTVLKIFEIAGVPYSVICRSTRMLLNLIKCPFAIFSFGVFSPDLFAYFKYLFTQQCCGVKWRRAVSSPELSSFKDHWFCKHNLWLVLKADISFVQKSFIVQIQSGFCFLFFLVVLVSPGVEGNYQQRAV